MKVTIFRIENPRYESIGNPVYGNQRALYKVPTLPAYAIIDSRLDLENSIHVDAGYIIPRYELLQDGVVTPGRFQDIFGTTSGILTIYHNGIKDYKLLFPHIKSESLKARLGEFADEASNAFESQSWISYCLMIGAVLEGLLYNEFGDLTFNKLIQKALNSELITAEETRLIDEIRETRNKIHANRHLKNIVGRNAALELSTIYDRLIKKDWSALSKNSGTT